MNTNILRFVDKYMESVLCVIIGSISKIFQKFSRREFRHKNIIVIKLWAIGESVLILPTIRALRERFPKSNICVLARKFNKEVFLDNKDINKLMLFEPGNILNLIKRYRKFDLAVDCEPYLNISALASFWLAKRRIGFGRQIRSLLYTDTIKFNDNQHAVQTFLDLARLVGADNKEGLIKLSSTAQEKRFVEEYLFKNWVKKDDLLIGVCIGSGGAAPSKRWPLEYFANLCESLIKKYNAKIIFVGSNSEKALIKQAQRLMKHPSINSAGKTNLRQLAYLIEKCKLFISTDTGPMHIAAAQGVKTIGLFGPETPVKYGPYKKWSVYKKVHCSPCLVGHKGWIKNCKNPICMKNIKVDDVLRIVERVL